MKLLTLFFIIQSSFIWGQVSRVNKFKVLSAHEKIWVIFHPFVVKKSLIISDMVKLTTQDVLKENLLKGNGNSGQVDAFRHVFWMANLTKSIGWRKAKRLGIAHERGNYKDYKKHRNEDGIVPDKISSEMDLFNNNIGIEIG
jgi:hypothetical protein